MGEVYLAEYRRLGRKLALKILPAEFTRDPDRVARASEGLGMAMQSLETRKLEEGQLLANRGW